MSSTSLRQLVLSKHKKKSAGRVRSPEVSGGTSPMLKLILRTLPQLSDGELQQVKALVTIQLERGRLDGSEERKLNLFYTVLSGLLRHDGRPVPPLHILRTKAKGKSYATVKTAAEQVWAVLAQLNITARADVVRTIETLYYVARNHLKNNRAPTTLLPVIQQLANSQSLVSQYLPGYPPSLVRRVLVGRVGLGTGNRPVLG